MKEPNIKTLNQILRGEHMAINGYESVMKTLDNNSVKEKLNGILQDHKRHAMEVNNRIIELKGNPEESTGATGLMANLKLQIEGKIFSEDHMLKELYKAEKRGIESVKEIIKGDLDAESLAMVNEMISTDEKHLLNLQQLIDQ